MNDALHMNLYNNYRYRTFSQIWTTADDFLNDYTNNGIKPTISTETATTLYYLLLARHADDHIITSNENMFKGKVFTLIFMYGPTWEKRLELQDEIRNLDITSIQQGSLAIYNHAYNPSSDPAMETGENGTLYPKELSYINDQNTTRYKKSITDAYLLWDQLLSTDVTAYFLDRFNHLFKKIGSEIPLYYTEDINEMEVIDESADN